MIDTFKAMNTRPLLLLLLLPGFAVSQTSDLRLPVTLAADSTDYDGKSSMMMFQVISKANQPNSGLLTRNCDSRS